MANNVKGIYRFTDTKTGEVFKGTHIRNACAKI